MAASGNSSLNESMQPGRMAPNNMMPINSSNMMPNMSNITNSPMVPMQNSMMHMQHLNPMQGESKKLVFPEPILLATNLLSC